MTYKSKNFPILWALGAFFLSLNIQEENLFKKEKSARRSLPIFIGHF